MRKVRYYEICEINVFFDTKNNNSEGLIDAIHLAHLLINKRQQLLGAGGLDFEVSLAER